MNASIHPFFKIYILMVVVGQAREKGILAGFNHLGGDG